MSKKANPKFKGKDPDKLRTLQNKVLGEIVSAYCQERSSSSKKAIGHDDNIEPAAGRFSSSEKTA
jgi:hypothetical protein